MITLISPLAMKAVTVTEDVDTIRGDKTTHVTIILAVTIVVAVCTAKMTGVEDVIPHPTTTKTSYVGRMHMLHRLVEGVKTLTLAMVMSA